MGQPRRSETHRSVGRDDAGGCCPCMEGCTVWSAGCGRGGGGVAGLTVVVTHLNLDLAAHPWQAVWGLATTRRVALGVDRSGTRLAAAGMAVADGEVVPRWIWLPRRGGESMEVVWVGSRWCGVLAWWRLKVVCGSWRSSGREASNVGSFACGSCGCSWISPMVAGGGRSGSSRHRAGGRFDPGADPGREPSLGIKRDV